MANPQRENGYTGIANEILEAVYSRKFNGTQLRILLLLWRYTYGYNRKEHDLSLSFIAEALGTAEEVVSRQITRLIRCGVICSVGKKKGSGARILRFCKDYDKWNIDENCNTQSVNTRVDKTVTTSLTDKLCETMTGQSDNNIQEYKNQILYLKESEELAQEVKICLKKWLEYKLERGVIYSKTAFRSLIEVTKLYSEKRGKMMVAAIIMQSIASGYTGIIWDKLGVNPYSSDEAYVESKYDRNDLELLSRNA